MNSNLKNHDRIEAMNAKITQMCMECNTQVSEKIIYDWIDPSDNIFGFKLITPYRKIFSLEPQLYPMKLNTCSMQTQLYYNVLCVKCNTKRDHWYCLHCNRSWNMNMKKCEFANICALCIEKEIADNFDLDCSCNICYTPLSISDITVA